MKNADWSKWSAIAEILSAIAIVITLLYLSVQTRYLAVQTDQNNELLRAQAGFNMLQNRVVGREEIYRNPELAEFRIRVSQARSWADLSAADALRMRSELQRQFLTTQWEYSQIIDGNLDLEEFVFRLDERGPEREEWERFKASLRPDFVEWMENLSFGENPD